MSVVKGLLTTALAFGFISMVGCSDDDNDTPADTSPPAISNLSHLDNDKIIGNRTITFTADVTDDVGATVTITHNGNPVSVTPSGNTYTASITLGDRTNNTIVVSASDADNTSTETLTLNYPFLAFSDGQTALAEIGQLDLNASEGPNRGASTAINTLSSPDDVEVIDGRLYIADRGNSRVSVFNAIPTTDNVDASFFIGQDSESTNGTGTNNDQLTLPSAVESGDGHLLVGSIVRAHYWTNVPTLGNDPANFVIGQAGFFTGTFLTCSQSALRATVSGISYVDGKVIVVNQGGHRVMIWNSVPSANGAAANMILGQESYDSCLANVTGANDSPTDKSMDTPAGVWSDGTRLVVADKNNNRVLIWNSFPTVNNQQADLVLGQLTFTTADVPSAMNATEFLQPNGVYSNGNQLFVSTGADRVLIWDSWPTSNEQGANRVLGYSSIKSTTPSTDGAGVSNPGGMDVYDDKLILADTGNHRVLIFQAP